MTSTATIVANTPGNFIIEVSIPKFVVMLMVDVYKLKIIMEKNRVELSCEILLVPWI